MGHIKFIDVAEVIDSNCSEISYIEKSYFPSLQFKDGNI